MKVIFFSNGNTIAFDEDGQVPELHEPWMLLYIQLLVDRGIDPTEVEFTMPDGRQAKVFEIEDGYNWEFSR